MYGHYIIRCMHAYTCQRTIKSTGTVHTSAKVRLTSVAISVPMSVVGRWCNDVIVALAMPSSACTELQRRAAQSVRTTFRISQWWRIRKTIRTVSGSPPKFNHYFFHWPTANLLQPSLKILCLIRSKVFLRKVANRQTNRQKTTTITYPPWRR